MDDRGFQLGGRNLEDSYHVGPTPLVTRYLFRDTDVYVELASGGEALARTFDRLWGFRAMVATRDDIQQHAPNDSLMAVEGAAADCADAGKPEDAAWQAGQRRATALHADREWRITERRRGRLLDEDRARIGDVIRRLAGRADPDAVLPVEHVALRLSAILEKAYRLSADIVRGGRKAADAERLFDALFKVL